jgi:probable phosphoglycerate mutase
VNSDQRVYVIRHGETQWSLSGQHTGRTDIPLTENGQRQARALQPVLAAPRFAIVLTSPLQRARETCDLAGLGRRATIDEDLLEWNYGEYEGLSLQQIRVAKPGWLLFVDGCPGGESPQDVLVRVDRVIERVRSVDGDVALFSHGHLLRVFAARWIGLPAQSGAHFLLDPATISTMGYYQKIPAILQWNARVDRSDY